GVSNALAMVTLAGLLWLATPQAGPNTPDATTVQTLAAYLLKTSEWSTSVGATLFAAGSTAFAYLLLRGRMIPRWLAWVGVFGSGLLVVCLPLALVGVLHGPYVPLVWLPVAVFELVLGPWLLIKGVPDR